MAKSSRKRRQPTNRPAPSPPTQSTQPTTAPQQAASVQPVPAPARERARRQRKPVQQSFFQRYRTALIAGGVGIAVLIVAFVILQSPGKAYACDSLLQPEASQTSDPNALGFPVPNMGRTHVVGGAITYATCPPTSGNHYSAAGKGPIRNAVYGPANEQAPGGWVHNLEHGAVVVLYRCPSGTLGSGDCATAEDMAQMQTWFDTAPVVNNCPKQAVVARFDTMSTPFAVVAWDRALLLDTFDLDLATNFAKQWTDVNAPEANLCT